MLNSVLKAKMRQLLLFFAVTSTAFAEPQLHLLFHIGAGSKGHFFVGGTIQNKGDKDIYQGFVVITPITADCFPMSPLLSEFGEIKAGQKAEFRVPVQGHLHGYKLNAIHAVDSFSNAVAVVDETIDVIISKRDDYISECMKARDKNR